MCAPAGFPEGGGREGPGSAGRLLACEVHVSTGAGVPSATLDPRRWDVARCPVPGTFSVLRGLLPARASQPQCLLLECLCAQRG